MNTLRDSLTVALAGAAGAAASSAPAAELSLTLELPRLPVAEYHRPYVAVWLERGSEQQPVATLAVWYDQKKKDNGGTKWLKDLRQWWRKGGQALAMPADGISGATRPPGVQTVALAGLPALQSLPAGEYQLVVEAARENGGRELQRLPLRWPQQGPQSAQAQGEHELGALKLEGRP